MPDMRRRLIETAIEANARGLNRGTAGNLSARFGQGEEAGFLITPTGMAYDALSATDIVAMRWDGKAEGRHQPSTEWRLHRDVYCARPEAGAILHAHSPFATSLACLRREIPAFHYMIARFGGETLRCAKYATFGTQALSDALLPALQGRSACLLANHGMLVFADDLEQVLSRAVELEALCEHYWRACLVGEPVLLDRGEMAAVLEKFAAYGQPR